MTESERRTHAHDAFRRLLEKFLALQDSEASGSFTVHYQGHRIRKIEWRTLDDADRWEVDNGAA